MKIWILHYFMCIDLMLFSLFFLSFLLACGLSAHELRNHVFFSLSIALRGYFPIPVLYGCCLDNCYKCLVLKQMQMWSLFGCVCLYMNDVAYFPQCFLGIVCVYIVNSYILHSLLNQHLTALQ